MTAFHTERTPSAEALAAWKVLSAALEASGPAPCAEDPDAWDVAPLDVAARVCAGCPIARECGDYAVAADERFGVWAGVDRERVHKARA